jgi:hypothetical protein
MDYPAELKLPLWEKKKGSLTDSSELPDRLKLLGKKHEAVDWALFSADWPKKSANADDLAQAFDLRDRQYKSKVLALKGDAKEVLVAAQRMAKDKAAGKPALEAAKAISAAANAYVKAIDDGTDALKNAYAKALAAMPELRKEDEEEEPGSRLLDPTHLFKQLNLCKRDPSRSMQFGFVDANVKEKLPAVLAMSPRINARKLWGVLQKETGIKTGAYGTARLVEGDLVLQLDKPLSGLVKKIRGPIKAAGFRVKKIMLWNADGTVFEEEPEDETDESPAGSKPKAEGPSEQDQYKHRLAALAPGLAQALKQQLGDVAKLQALSAFAQAKAQDGQYKAALQGLDALENALTMASAAAAQATPAQDAPPPADAFKTRLTALMPHLKAAYSAAGPAVQDIKSKVSEAGEAARQQDFAQAHAQLDAVEALLKLASQTPPTASATTSDTPEPSPIQAQWDRRVAAIEPQVLAAQKSRANEAQWMTIFTMAQDLASEGNFAKANQLLDKLKTLLKAPPAAPAKPERAGPGQAIGLVNYAKLLLRWRKAQELAAANLAEFGQTFLAMPEVQDDPRLDQVRRAMGKLPGLIPKFGEALADQLDRADKGGPDAANSLNEALSSIAAYRQQLAAVPVLVKLADFAREHLKAELPSASELDAALEDIATAVSAAKEQQA